MSYLKSKLPELSPSVEREAWRQALLDAAEYIRVHGHCREIGRDSEGRVCTLGALVLSGCKMELRTDVESRLCGHLGLRTTSILKWNDAPERAAADVISALEACARQG